MAASTYEAALARLLAHEGGYTNHPSDPGGPTNFGITIRDYRQYVKASATAADVKMMALDEAERIYRAKYWDAQRCDDLPAGIDNAIFDYGVNSGIGRSGKVLRRCLDLSEDTSLVSDRVVAAAIQADAAELVAAICDERLRFLRSLRTWSVFGKGWGRRVAEVKAFSLSLATGTPAAKAAKTTKKTKGAGASTGKAVVPVAKAAQRGSSGAIAAVGIATAHQAHQSGSSVTAVATIVIAAVALTIVVWLLWHWRQAKRQEMPS